MKSVRDSVVKLVTEICRPRHPDLSDHSRPLLDSGLDSLDYTNVLMEIEDRFKVKVEDKELDRLGSIDKIVEFIEKGEHS